MVKRGKKCKMKSKINNKEKDIVLVMCDILDRGSPETCIAKYMLEKKIKPERLTRFLFKLNFSMEWVSRIRWAYDELKRNEFSLDGSQHAGKDLRLKIFGDI